MSEETRLSFNLYPLIVSSIKILDMHENEQFIKEADEQFETIAKLVGDAEMEYSSISVCGKVFGTQMRNDYALITAKNKDEELLMEIVNATVFVAYKGDRVQAIKFFTTAIAAAFYTEDQVEKTMEAAFSKSPIPKED